MDGTPFGRYRLVELLGRGGMGEVWRAHDVETDRIVALKLLPPYLSDDDEFQERFRREAHTAARLNNPHIIPIHNYGEIEGQLYVDMRLIEGRDLQTLLADGPLDLERAVGIIGQVAKALHTAHQAGLLHRDIKPSNILVDGDDFAYLIDFGIARAIDDTRMTKSGDTLGTFQYIAPERLDVQALEDARADIYSLACVLYESLTGHPPFPGNTMAHLVTAHLNSPPPRASVVQPNVPAQVDEVIATGMAKDPDQRYASTIELANAARDAITVPIPLAAPTGVPPASRVAPSPGRPAAGSTLAAITQPRGSAAAQSLADDQPPAAVPPTPWWRQRTPARVAAAIVVLLAAAGATGYLLRPNPSASHAAASSLPTGRPAPPAPASRLPVPAPGLADLLLSPNNLATAVGAGDMNVTGNYTDLVADSTTDQACVGVVRSGSAAVYAAGHTGVRGQVVVSQPTYVVVQYVVSLRSAQDASAILATATKQWPSCSGRPIRVQTPGFESKIDTVGPVSDADGTLTTTVTSSVAPVLCERALSVANNVAIDITACGRAGAAINIAHQIAAKVPA
jgi:serine/threonine-protein kinase